ncbi:hypothetical protein LAZ67_8000007 [Cordylochernes scorpioides]|uniref:Cadherin domain-containing protein n=1 Tax=Cordylochernes scorpioides TaxID=51811 RepID=A0ABY6KU37_9ARAC|nr:hypothetical protein LAZ67_8000007 [Cordylochernes scorpioides]
MITEIFSGAAGEVVGALQINGDPGEGGDILLSVRGPEPPVVTRPGTRQLVLQAPLDKEGERGLQAVAIEVVCTRRQTDDPSITIPVRFVVTDVNDNAPRFIGAPFSVSVSEGAPVSSAVLAGVRAEDKDQEGPFSTVEFSIEDGPHSHLVAIDNPLAGDVTLAQSLDFEALQVFTVTLRAQDQGSPPLSAHATLTVHVLDADDQNPHFDHDRYTAPLPDRPGEELDVSPEPIRAVDPDVGINASIQYSFNSDSPEYSFFTLDPATATVRLKTPLPEAFPQPVLLVVRATQRDNANHYSLATLAVSSSVPLLPAVLRFSPPHYSASVLENSPPGTTLLAVHTNRPMDQTIRFKLAENPDGAFTIKDNGEIAVAVPLDFESRKEYLLRVVAASTSSQMSAVAAVNVTVINVNDHDPQFQQSNYEFYVSGRDVRVGALVGKVEVSDLDEDEVDLSLKGPMPMASMFSINGRGELRVRDLGALNHSAAHLVVVARDSGDPPRQASVPVSIQFAGDLLRRSAAARDEGPFILMVVFGILLGTLLVVIVTLAVYIVKQ